MNFDYKADGEIHKLDDNWAYILKCFPLSIFIEDKINSEKDELISDYLEYLYKFDKEFVLNVLFCVYKGWEVRLDNYEFVIRNSLNIDALNRNGSIALKFMRCLPDNMDDI